MSSRLISPFTAALFLFSGSICAAPRESTILFDHPALDWEREALPVGNGRIGAMIFGGVMNDRIQFNDITLWTGDSNPSGGYECAGDRKNMMGSFQNCGDVTVTFGEEGVKEPPPPPGYRRELNLSTARVTTTFSHDGTNFTREAFASAKDDLIVVRYTADKPGRHTGSVRLKDARNNPTSGKGDTLAAPGSLANGLLYESRVRVLHDGGTVALKGDTLVFKGCDSLTLCVAARTNYVPDIKKNWLEGTPRAALDKDMVTAKKPYATLRPASEKAHRELMDRVAFDIGETPTALREKTTAARIGAYRKGGEDPDLEEDLFNFCRYLLIGCSRGPLPANLQGLWNNTNTPPWASDYHTNINVQMNYWAAEPLALPELHMRLLDFVIAQKSACRTAMLADKKQFPNSPRGWTARTTQNTMGGNGWDWNIPASAWYMLHFREHHAFTQDTEFLKKVAYPAMREVCDFWEDNLKSLTEDGGNFFSSSRITDAGRASLKGIKAGALVAPNGWSPEHGPREDGVAHDQQIIWDLFTNTAEAAEILGDKSYAKKITGLRERLVGPRIGKWGQLQEWMIDRDDPKNLHRHTSPLFAVYPGRQISTRLTPELAKAATLLLKSRCNDMSDKPFTAHTVGGDSRRSWTWPWRCAMWARLGDAERAGTMLRGQLTHNTMSNLFAWCGPFQIDGNLGIGGGIAEMLIQSHADEVRLIPAIPKNWADGRVSGLRARGGFTVNEMAWKGGKIVSAEIRSNAGMPLRLNAGLPVVVKRDGAIIPTEEKDGAYFFATKAGATYSVTAK